MDAGRKRLLGTVVRIVGFPAAAVAGGVVTEVVVHDEVALMGTWGGALVYGVVANRWWTAALPVAWIGGYLAVLRVGDLLTGECSACGGDIDGWGSYLLLALLIAVAPCTIGVLLGVGARKLGRRLRRVGR